MFDMLIEDVVAAAGFVGRRGVYGGMKFRFYEWCFRWVLGFAQYRLSP